MGNTIESNLVEGWDKHACELWKLHRDGLNKHLEKGSKSGKNKRVAVHPVILN